MTWQQEIDGWLQACQTAGGLHMLSNAPDPGRKAPSIALVCIPSFPGNPIPDDLRVRLRADQFFESVKRFRGFPNVMSMIGDGWLYWDAYLTVLPESNWARKRVKKAIRITVHMSLSQDLLQRLLLRENLYHGLDVFCWGRRAVVAWRCSTTRRSMPYMRSRRSIPNRRLPSSGTFSNETT